MKHNMEAKHTPGSWNYWHKSETDENIVSIHEEHSNLERVIAIVSEEADCPLIASSPELLEVSKTALRLWDTNGNLAGVFSVLRDIIAKVEGRA